jgi:hypothetical protein
MPDGHVAAVCRSAAAGSRTASFERAFASARLLNRFELANKIQVCHDRRHPLFGSERD